ncbi:hypothetical protein CONPUDRAFT_48689 [Coniophora puteana RWD-64-598 SS2]|uniref:ARM repeat-containing protein n=1 Tax=Coniophora puteana (strain RWD-64-598) TaxID=741705 RepID=A0A5M3N2X4_CONPW|nr:uncharacterized protein CONPUDRAFT_48689 [Coniophora puteana RWD-64-598 SS2]EIW85225.1 hypothetical protein CONPUDRAFT_48689 [Coniophora puteana RWD-64-598 SS2]
MDQTTSSCLDVAHKLNDQLVQLTSNKDPQTWTDVASTAQLLANSLRVRNGPEDIHTVLGKSPLPQTITALLKTALENSQIPDNEHSAAVLELLRVGANLCVEHDQNRGQLLEAGLPQAIVSLLEGYSDSIPSGIPTAPLAMSISNLKVVKTAIGVLLNASVDYEPVKSRLTSLEAAMTLVRLSFALYPPGSWMTSTSSLNEITEDSWTLRSGLSNWAWRLISELRDEARPVFEPSVLPYLVSSLISHTPPTLTVELVPAFTQPSDLRTLLLQADFDLFSESCSLIESLSLDVEDVRLSLARGFQFPAEHDGIPCLTAMLDFIQLGYYPPLWYKADTFEGHELRSKEKAFDDCKGAVIKSIVELSGEDKNVDVLWDDSEEDKPGGSFVARMVQWVINFAASGPHGNARDDLVICATLTLGNLTRRESHSKILLSEPYNLASLLASDTFLSTRTDIKVKHGVVGLLKHLSQTSAQSPANRAVLSRAGVIQKLVASGIWDERSDVMADIVQVNAIGAVKHLCNGNVDNCFLLTLPEGEGHATGLEQLLELIRRSDTVAIKSEGTRVIVNIVKSLWASDVSESQIPIEERQKKREQSIDALLTPKCAQAIAALIARSVKYPVLINEGIVALSLLSTHAKGGSWLSRDSVDKLTLSLGPLVVQSLVAILPAENNQALASNAAANGLITVGNDTDSPLTAAPKSRLPSAKRAIDQVVAVLRNNANDGASTPQRAALPSYPVEVRTNTCALLAQVSKTGSGEDLDKVKEATRSVLEDLASKNPGHGRESMLYAAAKRVVDAWT